VCLQTVKYLYLSFVDSGALLDFYVLSTEGHILPSFGNPVDAHVEEDDYLEVRCDSVPVVQVGV
jgi:hypothetical protein